MMDFGDCTEVSGPQYALNLYTLAESSQATRILEIGAGWGWSSRAFALSLANRSGTLISIDPHTERIKAENRGRIAALSMTWDIRNERSGDNPLNDSIDILYIDGDPRNAGTDFVRYYENVRPGGYIVLDGYGGQPGPTEFCEGRVGFLPLRYSEVFSHAVFCKPLPAVEHAYEGRCGDCPMSFTADNWSGLDTVIDRHVESLRHTVNAVARNVRYKKGPR